MILFKEHAHILPYKNPYVFLASYAIFPLINVILRIWIYIVLLWLI